MSVMFRIFVFVSVYFNFAKTANNEVEELFRPLSDEVNDEMVANPEVKFSRKMSKIEKNAWRLLKKYVVMDIEDFVTKDVTKRVVSNCFFQCINLQYFFNSTCAT